jgi:hypothetical protein
MLSQLLQQITPSRFNSKSYISTDADDAPHTDFTSKKVLIDKVLPLSVLTQNTFFHLATQSNESRKE